MLMFEKTWFSLTSSNEAIQDTPSKPILYAARWQQKWENYREFNTSKVQQKWEKI